MKLNKKLTVFLTISLFFLTSFGLASTMGLATNSKMDTADTTSSGVEYDYDEDYVYDTWMNQTWDHVTNEYNYSSSYSDNYTYTYEYYFEDINGNTLKRKIFYDNYYEANTTSYSRQTMTGEMNQHLIFDTYRVDISYGDGLDLTWFGFKNGTMYMRQLINESTYYHKYNSSYEYKRTRVSRTYNDTNGDGIYETHIEEEDDIDFYEDKGNYEYNYTSNMFDWFGDTSNVSAMKFEVTQDILVPLTISIQKYNTQQNDQKIAWGETLFPQFYLYNDTNEDGIFSMDKNTQGMGIGMSQSDECRGHLMPQMMKNMESSREFIYENGTSEDVSDSSYYSMDMYQGATIKDIVENIEFKAPSETSDGLDWSIDYNGVPLMAYLTGDNYYSLNNRRYEWSSPTDFKYGFNYDVGDDRADLSQTFGMSKITNETLYENLQGLGLSSVHYNFFLSSDQVKQETNNAATVPADFINYTLAGTPAAQIDMGKEFPEKKNYTLHDYPSDGTNTEFGSLGSTVSQLIISSKEQGSAESMYSMVDMMKGFITPTIEDDPYFDTYQGVLSMATQNYPVWSGEKLVHDPTFSVFYSSSEGSPTPDKGIPGFFYIPLFATVVITVSVIANKMRKERL